MLQQIGYFLKWGPQRGPLKMGHALACPEQESPHGLASHPAKPDLSTETLPMTNLESKPAHLFWRSALLVWKNGALFAPNAHGHVALAAHHHLRASFGSGAASCSWMEGAWKVDGCASAVSGMASPDACASPPSPPPMCHRALHSRHALGLAPGSTIS